MKTDAEAWKFLEDLAEKTMQWEGFNEKAPTHRESTNPSKGGIHAVDTSIAHEEKLAALMRRLEAIEDKNQQPKHTPAQVNQVGAPGCINYQNPANLMEESPPPMDTTTTLQEQINAVFQRARNDSF